MRLGRRGNDCDRVICYNSVMNKKLVRIMAGVSAIGMLFMLNYTNPVAVGAVGVLVFFTMVFVLIFWMMLERVEIIQTILGEKRSKQKKAYWYALILSLAPIFCLLLRRSEIELGLYSYAVVVFLTALGCGWVYKKE